MAIRRIKLPVCGICYSFSLCVFHQDLSDNLEQLSNQFFSSDALGVSIKTLIVNSMLMVWKLRKQPEECPLLWRTDSPNVPDSKANALRLLNCLQRK